MHGDGEDCGDVLVGEHEGFNKYMLVDMGLYVWLNMTEMPCA